MTTPRDTKDGDVTQDVTQGLCEVRKKLREKAEKLYTSLYWHAIVPAKGMDKLAIDSIEKHLKEVDTQARDAALEEAAKWTRYYSIVNENFEYLEGQLRSLKSASEGGVK